jgi:hypothetical protein
MNGTYPIIRSRPIEAQMKGTDDRRKPKAKDRPRRVEKGEKKEECGSYSLGSWAMILWQGIQKDERHDDGNGNDNDNDSNNTKERLIQASSSPRKGRQDARTRAGAS